VVPRQILVVKDEGSAVKPLRPDCELERSEIVANSRMNRERGCAGPNSYAREIGLDPLEFLHTRLRTHERAAWLDLCCGRGRALIEAARHFTDQGSSARVTLNGIDLVSAFDPIPPDLDGLRLEEASAASWEPDRAFDLITCVHGLHYIGDKLRLIQRAASWLAPDGVFLAHLDLDNLKDAEGGDAGRRIMRNLRKNGLDYDSRRHLLRCEGGRTTELAYEYLGADDSAGPNYSRQPAVDSYYQAIRVFSGLD
jgi:SAM-dependent methyltransferase